MSLKSSTDNTDFVMLSVDAIKDFRVCELYYKYKYLDKISYPMTSTEILDKRYENVIRKVAHYFFHKVQGDQTPSYKALLKRWEKMWFPDGMTAYDISVMQHTPKYGSIITHNNIAVAALETFHNEFNGTDAIPIMIDEYFVAPLGENLRLKVNVDLMTKEKDNYTVYKWIGTKSRFKSEDFILDFAALKYAVERTSDKKRKITYKLYNLTDSVKPFVKQPQPKKADIEALIYWGTATQSRENLVPRRGTTLYCRGCAFDDECLQWNNWKKATVENS